MTMRYDKIYFNGPDLCYGLIVVLWRKLWTLISNELEITTAETAMNQ